ncbi:hypothetical protein KKH15_02875 [Patescibacteria group bacterium]|nr:hypothetical protein [Patescibacteria group bacterium]MBU1755299.1 hypothetical protein [Patescibacteria group bacterium]
MDTRDRSLLMLGDVFFANSHHDLTAEELRDIFPQLGIDDLVIAMYAGRLGTIEGRHVLESTHYKTCPNEDWQVLTIFKDLGAFGVELLHFCNYVVRHVDTLTSSKLIATPVRTDNGERVLAASFAASQPHISLYEPASTPETKEVTWLTYRL